MGKRNALKVKGQLIDQMAQGTIGELHAIVDEGRSLRMCLGLMLEKID